MFLLTFAGYGRQVPEGLRRLIPLNRVNAMNMKKQLYLSFSLFLMGLGAPAQTARTFTLSNSSDGESELTVFLPDHPTGRAIVDCPGGGYSHLAMGHEGTDWATYFNEKGVTYCVLKYRMPHGDRTRPLTDAYHALQTVRDSAAVWKVNPYDVGIMGFSAGGHLAASVSTHAPFAARPNFTILFYPVITMDEHAGHRGSVVGFLGEGRNDKDLVAQWSNERQVRRHLTPPALILLANDDKVVPPVTNAVAYYSAMRRQGNDCAMMIYPDGGHGFGFNERYRYHHEMLRDLDVWLARLKAPRIDAIRVACIGNSITDGSGIDMSDQNAYPAQLQRLLGEDYIVKNYGVSARTMLHNGDHPYMKEMAWRDALAFNPQAVVIKLGTNDSKAYNWKHGNEFAADMQEMIDSLKKLPARPRIYLSTPIMSTPNRYGIRDSVVVNDIIPIIRKLAKRNKCAVIDLHSEFNNADGKQLQDDGVHPTAAGAEQMAHLVAAALEPKK